MVCDVSGHKAAPVRDAAQLSCRGVATKLPRELWLPEELVEPAVKAAPKLGSWKLEPAARNQPAKLSCVVENVGTVTGTYTLAGNRVEKVSVTIVKAADTAPAK